MKKSTERKRIKRMQKDAGRLLVHHLIGAKSYEQFMRALGSALRKV